MAYPYHICKKLHGRLNFVAFTDDKDPRKIFMELQSMKYYSSVALQTTETVLSTP